MSPLWKEMEKVKMRSKVSRTAVQLEVLEEADRFMSLLKIYWG